MNWALGSRYVYICKQSISDTYALKSLRLRWVYWWLCGRISGWRKVSNVSILASSISNFSLHWWIVIQSNSLSVADYIRGAYDNFPDFFVWAFKIVVDSWKFNMLLLYILWDDWPIFMISCSNEQIHQELDYTLLKPDCHSWWISKMQSDTLEEQYTIKLCLKLGKKCHRNVWNASDCFSTI